MYLFSIAHASLFSRRHYYGLRLCNLFNLPPGFQEAHQPLSQSSPASSKTPPVNTSPSCSSWSFYTSTPTLINLLKLQLHSLFSAVLSAHVALTLSTHSVELSYPRPRLAERTPETERRPLLVISLRQPVGGFIASIPMQLISIKSPASHLHPHLTHIVLVTLRPGHTNLQERDDAGVGFRSNELI